MNQQSVIDQLIQKTYDELTEAEQPTSRSRAYNSPRGYRFLVPWSNAVLLRILVRKLTDTLPRSEYRTKTQLDDAARSIVSNIEEGYRRPSTQEYLRFLGYSEGSLEEVHGLLQQAVQDKFIQSIPQSSLASVGINLQAWSTWARDPKNSPKLLYFPLTSSKKPEGSYRNLEELTGRSLTFELLRELINKTDYTMRKLVQSLEHKLDSNRKSYQIEQARIGRNIRGGR